VRCALGFSEGRIGRLEVTVENVSIHVSPVRPHDRPEFLVDADLPEQRWTLTQGREDWTPKLGTEVNIALAPIVEDKP
jgi:hypothetical protein